MTALAPGRDISLDDAKPPSRDRNADNPASLDACVDACFADTRDGVAIRAQEMLERRLIERALRESHGHRQQAARRLGWGRNTLTRKMQRYGVDD